MPSLFDPLKAGALELPNRIVMAPLTRSRATPDARVPTQLQLDYYVQRASAGLIISEATSVTPRGVGYAATPGIWSDEQTEGWKRVVDAVHKAGGRIVLQLWHVGRISDPLFLNGELPEAPSASSPRAMSRWYGRKRIMSRHVPSNFPKSRASSPSSRRVPRTPRSPALTASISTAPTAICWTSSCRIPPIIAPMPMAAAWRNAPA